MFDIGFPKELFAHLSTIFNASTVSDWLISYQGPKKIVDKYKFEVEFMFQISTSMHGSGEGHSCYFYKRASAQPKARRHLRLESRSVGEVNSSLGAPCDPLFAEAWKMVKSGAKNTFKWTEKELSKLENSGRPTRERKAITRYE